MCNPTYTFYKFVLWGIGTASQREWILLVSVGSSGHFTYQTGWHCIPERMIPICDQGRHLPVRTAAPEVANDNSQVGNCSCTGISQGHEHAIRCRSIHGIVHEHADTKSTLCCQWPCECPFKVLLAPPSMTLDGFVVVACVVKLRTPVLTGSFSCCLVSHQRVVVGADGYTSVNLCCVVSPETGQGGEPKAPRSMVPLV